MPKMRIAPRERQVYNETMKPPLVTIQGREVRFPRWPRFDAWLRANEATLLLTLSLYLGSLVLIWYLLPRP